ncbi:transporter [Pseudoteredinibacter isoporae]|uniref:transporter n=1 Tax=Pseudoteredinibacter isoporae TaxID=570281 RepID=UPI003104D74B
MKKLILASMLMATPVTLLAEGSPWLLSPGETRVQLSYVSQEADRLFAGDNEVDIPGGGDLEQSTYWISLSHGINDDLEIDFRAGYSDTDIDGGSGQDGITDTTIGLTWRFHDEFLSESNAPSAAIRVAATIDGDYDTGAITAIGDGASGVEASIILGKAFTSQFAVSGDIGYRYRDSNVANEAFLNLAAYYAINDKLSTSIAYHKVDARDGLDIGGPGFTPSRFPEVEEDYDLYEIGINYTITSDLSFGVSYGSLFEGKNAPKSDVISASFGFTF